MVGYKKKHTVPMKNYNHDMDVHRVRFFLSQHWSEEEISQAMRIPVLKVRELVKEAQLRDGKYDLV